jgi:hypothetical protein
MEHAYSTTNHPVKKMTGYALARNGRTASQRAALAASIIAGEVEFTKPTKKQIAELLHVSVSYVDKVLKLDPVCRKAMTEGYLALSDFQNTPSDAQLSRAIKAVGVDHAFDVMTADMA